MQQRVAGNLLDAECRSTACQLRSSDRKEGDIHDVGGICRDQILGQKRDVDVILPSPQISVASGRVDRDP